MFKGTVSGYTAIENTNIAFTPKIESNSKTGWKSTNNTIQIKKIGYFEVDAHLVMTGVSAGTITTSLMANGTSVAEAQSISMSTATTDSITVNVHDILKITQQVSNSFVELGLQLSSGATITSGLITVQEVC